jgi:hypothetical protein
MFDRISRASAKYKGYDESAKKFSELSDPTITENDAYCKFFSLAKKYIGPGYKYEAQRRVLEKKMKRKNKI